jgi:hypothetical protein
VHAGHARRPRSPRSARSLNGAKPRTAGDPESLRSGRYPATPWSEARLYRPFVLAAIACGLGGFATGGLFLAGAVTAGDALDIHAALQLLGWCGLFVLGVAMHVVPRFQNNAPLAFPWPQRLSLVLIVGGLLAGTGARLGLAGSDGDVIAATSAATVGVEC